MWGHEGPGSPGPCPSSGRRHLLGNGSCQAGNLPQPPHLTPLTPLVGAVRGWRTLTSESVCKNRSHGSEEGDLGPRDSLQSVSNPVNSALVRSLMDRFWCLNLRISKWRFQGARLMEGGAGPAWPPAQGHYQERSMPRELLLWGPQAPPDPPSLHLF